MKSREIAKNLVKGNWYADLDGADSENVSFLRFSHVDGLSLCFDAQSRNGEYGFGWKGFIIFPNGDTKFFEPTKEDIENSPKIFGTPVVKESFEEKYNKLLEEFEQYKLESIKWSVEDFMEHDGYSVTKEQAQEALERMIARHDADQGITWGTVQYYLDEILEKGY
jgi:hypothetical protein